MGNTTTHPDQRSIFLIGETGAGKSSLGNFILRRTRFTTGNTLLSTTQKMESESYLYTTNTSDIQLHIFDMPGLNDPRMSDSAHLTDTYHSLKQSCKTMCCVFAIIINPSFEDDLEDGVHTILDFFQKLKFPGFDFLENAVVVFTHADKLGNTSDEQMTKLFSITEKSPNLHKLLTAVRSRLLLINSLNYKNEQYWREILEHLIQFCMPKFNFLLIGPHTNAKSDLMKLIYDQMGVSTADEQLVSLSLDYENKHLTLYKINTKEDNMMQCVESGTQYVDNTMQCVVSALLTPGTMSSFCILFHCRNKVKNTFFRSINDLATSLTDNNPDLFYKCSFILFLHDNDQDVESKVKSGIDNVKELKELVTRVSNRYFIFNCSPNVAQPKDNIKGCFENLILMSKEIKQLIYDEKYREKLLNHNAIENHDTASNYSKRGVLGLAIGGTALVAVGLGAIVASTVVVLTGGAATPIVAAPLCLYAAPLMVAAPVAAPLLGAAPVVAPLLGAAPVGIAVAGITATGAGVVSNAIALCTAIYNKLSSSEANKKIRNSDDNDTEFEYDFATGQFVDLKDYTD